MVFPSEDSSGVLLVARAKVSIRGGGAKGESVDDEAGVESRCGAMRGFGAGSDEDGEDRNGFLSVLLPSSGEAGG